MKTQNKGFTLIELLVVIAIIGILASVVLASLNSARSKGADAAIKANLANIRAQAALFYDNQTPASYGTPTTAGNLPGNCTFAGSVFADATIASAITQADAQNGSTTNSIVCNSTASTFAVASVLRTDPTQAYCVDSNGTGKVKTGLTSGDASGAISTTAGATLGLCN